MVVRFQSVSIYANHPTFAQRSGTSMNQAHHNCVSAVDNLWIIIFTQQISTLGTPKLLKERPTAEADACDSANVVAQSRGPRNIFCSNAAIIGSVDYGGGCQGRPVG